MKPKTMRKNATWKLSSRAPRILMATAITVKPTPDASIHSAPRVLPGSASQRACRRLAMARSVIGCLPSPPGRARGVRAAGSLATAAAVVATDCRRMDSRWAMYIAALAMTAAPIQVQISGASLKAKYPITAAKIIRV